MKEVLIIGGAEVTRGAVGATARRRGYTPRSADTGAYGLAVHQQEAADLIFVLLPLPDSSGRALMNELRKIDGKVPIIVTGRDYSIQGAPEALEYGAYEYIEDALHDTNELLAMLGLNLNARRTDVQLRYLRRKDSEGASLQTVVGECVAMKRVFATVRQVCHRTFRGGAPTILITGETGTGKGLIAKAIHYNSVRRSRALVDVNCAAIPAALIEAELFGHARGAFTDARAARPGLFETADGGTLFLDEIASMPLDLQGKLLTAIEEKSVRRLGGNDPTYVDVQVVAATPKDLATLVAKGLFRDDLFHRLNVVAIAVPPLRDRGDDRILLAESLVAELCKEYGLPHRTLAADARRVVESYHWPGNVRELRNQIERILLLQESDVIEAEHFQIDPTDGASQKRRITFTSDRDDPSLDVELPEGGFSLEALEGVVIRKALERHGHNVSQTARYLGITRHTLIYRMKKHDIQRA